jgi:hypothetical protein
LAVATPVILASQHKTTKVAGTHASTTVTPDALLLSGVVLLFCLLGAVALRRRRRSLLAFAFFVIGFAFTLPFPPPLGFAIIILGGWLMLRAWRLQKYGTTNSKQVARQAAARPSRKARQQAAKTPVKPTGHKAPTANKRYTPKAPSKKKIPKPAPDG